MGRTDIQLTSLLVMSLATILLSACSSGSSPTSFATTSMASTASGVQINPSVQTVQEGGQFQFSATGGLPPYTFSVVSGEGSIDSSTGVYSAPGNPGSAQISVQDSTGSTAYATVTVGAGGSSNTLAVGPDNQTIAPGATLQLSVSGGAAPYVFSIVSGGGTINSSTGLYTAPSQASTVEVQVSDSSTPSQQVAYVTITVGNQGSTSSTGGPTTIYSMGAATSNDVLSGWPATNATDGSPFTSYSSAIFASSANDRGTYLAAWISGAGPQNVSYVILTARMVNGQPAGFPQSYDISLTAPDNSAWNPVGTFNTQPDPTTGVATVALPSVYSTYGVMITPQTLGTDNVGNYVFQMAEVNLAN